MNPVPSHRSGFVSILGRPNAGKSTLLNALVGQKLAIVADKPQTTRTTIQGVWTSPEAQVVFIDTPGIHDADSLINRRMMQSIQEALDQRDLLLFLHDANAGPGERDEAALELVRRTGTPAFLLLNKVDRLKSRAALLPHLEWFRQRHDFAEYFPISAKTLQGVEELRAAILARLPEGPAYFPEDHVTDQPERFIAAEIIREKILLLTRQEVPHSVAVLIDQWEDTPRITRVAATIHVERTGQKAIVLGSKGSRLKEIGTQARLEIESLLGRRFFLSLFVKVSPDWRENPSFLRDLDWRAQTGAEYSIPAEKDDNEGQE